MSAAVVPLQAAQLDAATALLAAPFSAALPPPLVLVAGGTAYRATVEGCAYVIAW